MKKTTSSLSSAVRRDDIVAAKILIDKGLSPFDAEDDCVPFVIACQYGNIELIKLFLNCNMESCLEVAQPMNGYTGLVAACNYNQLEVVKLLIENGANVNFIGQGISSPLAKALGCVESNTFEVVKYLLEHGADPNVKFFNKNNNCVATVLTIACEAKYGSPQLIELLIQYGADVNAKCDNGNALATAVIYKKAKIVEVLLKHNANATFKMPNNSYEEDYRGLTPIEIAKKLKAKSIVDLLSRIKN
jgi:ankyrin repeat protein